MLYLIGPKKSTLFAWLVALSALASFGQRIINDILTLPTELPTGSYTLEVFDNFNTVLAMANSPDDLYAL